MGNGLRWKLAKFNMEGAEGCSLGFMLICTAAQGAHPKVDYR